VTFCLAFLKHDVQLKALVYRASRPHAITFLMILIITFELLVDEALLKRTNHNSQLVFKWQENSKQHSITNGKGYLELTQNTPRQWLLAEGRFVNGMTNCKSLSYSRTEYILYELNQTKQNATTRKHLSMWWLVSPHHYMVTRNFSLFRTPLKQHMPGQVQGLKYS
jgi:hypothetical protein